MKNENLEPEKNPYYMSNNFMEWVKADETKQYEFLSKSENLLVFRLRMLSKMLFNKPYRQLETPQKNYISQQVSKAYN